MKPTKRLAAKVLALKPGDIERIRQYGQRSVYIHYDKTHEVGITWNENRRVWELM